MKKLNTKRYSLISDSTLDWFHPDLINNGIIDDNPDIMVSDLNEEQAKQALCLALKTIGYYERQLDKIRELTDL